MAAILQKENKTHFKHILKMLLYVLSGEGLAGAIQVTEELSIAMLMFCSSHSTARGSSMHLPIPAKLH